MKNKCKCCNGEYTVGVDGKFCSESCKLIQKINYEREVKEAMSKIYYKYYG